MGPNRRTFPFFELPDVVMDLDAEGSPHVRPFEAERDGPLQESIWGYDPIADEVEREARSMKQDMSRDIEAVKSVTRFPFAGIRLSDVDVMAVALMAGSTHLQIEKNSPSPKLDTETYRTSELQKDLDRNGIPKTMRKDVTKVIPFMLHRLQLTFAALKDPSRRRSSGGNDEQELQRGIARCENFAQLKRLSSRIGHPESGIELSSTSVDCLHARLVEFLRSSEGRVTSEDILKFVNNFTINRLSTNKELNRSMTLFGLQLACDLGLLSCILQYLQICLSMEFITNRAEGVTLTRSLIGSALLTALQRGEGTARGTRAQIFTLITGRGSDDLAPQASLFGLATDAHEQKPEIFTLCITLLGELGALRLLVHHWRQRANQLIAIHQLKKTGWQQWQGIDETDDLFVKSFMRCTQLLGGVKDEEISVDLTTITGDIDRDAALDWRNINVVDAVHTRRGSKIPKPSLMNLQSSISVDDVKDAFNKPDMRVSMVCFQELIEKATKRA